MPFEAEFSRPRFVLLTLGCLLFAVAGLWMSGVFGAAPSADTTTRVIGWLTVPFWGLLALSSARRLLRPGVELRIDRAGIFSRTWSDQVIPWSAITGFREVTINRQRALCLTTSDPSAFPPKGRLMRATRRLNRLVGFGDVWISMGNLNRNHTEIRSAVMEFAPPTCHGWQPGNSLTTI